MSTITKGSGDDEIFGSTGNDTLKGGSGNDQIVTRGGTDYAYGENGDDNINGYLGSDGNYRYWESSGEQWLYGGEGDDIIYGGTDVDNILGEAGNDYLKGKEGNDVISGGLGNDQLYGEEGNDTLNGGAGSDWMRGGEGDDTYYIDDIWDDVYDTSGNDTLHIAVDYYNVDSTIENIQYSDGVKELPYWIDALIYDASSVHHYHYVENNKTFKYLFPQQTLSYFDAKDLNGWSAGSSSLKAAFVHITSLLTRHIDVNFIQTANAYQANTIAVSTNAQTGSGGYATPPNSNRVYSSFKSSDIFMDESNADPSITSPNNDLDSLVHELGHALGLKHPFSHENASGNIAQTPYLTSSLEENTRWTAMSYTDDAKYYSTSFRPLDLAALQYLYGVSSSANAGDTTYTFSKNEGTFVYDGQGTDTIDATTATAAATIYLTQGDWSYIGIKSDLITASHQLTINFNTVIESVKGGSFNDSLYGNDIDNIMEGNSGSDDIYGYLGNDTISGGQGNDRLYGGDGADEISTGSGDDIVYGGTGNDNINGHLTPEGDYPYIYDPSSGLQWLYGGDGDDTVIGGSNIDNITGGTGNDWLNGREGNDVISGDDGEDVIIGWVGDDILSGGVGNDVLYGGDGNDELYGGDGTDIIYTGSGDDIVRGGTGNDNINGSFDREEYIYDDAVSGGTQWLYGDDGDDNIFGGVNADHLYGGTGVDFLIGGDGNDRLFGGTGNDTLYTDNGTDYVEGGLGDDILYSYLDEGSKTLKGGAGDDIVYGGINDDFLYGDAGNDIVEGGDGDDFLYGGEGNDVLYGEAGNDTTFADGGSDTIKGGTGIDTIKYTLSQANYTLAVGKSNSTVKEINTNTNDSFSTIERIVFADNAIALDIDGANSAGGIYRTYQAAFNRTPDKAGFGYWIDRADNGASAVQMAEGFVGSAEFQTLYGVTTSDNYLVGNNIEAVVDLFYQNVLGRTPDPVGLAYYTNTIVTQDKTGGRVLAEIADSAENRVNLLPTIENGMSYDLWVA